MPVKFDIEVKGIQPIQRALKSTGAAAFYAEPYRDATVAIGQLGEAIAARAAPRRTGRTESQITHAVQKTALPRWIRIGSYAKRRSRKYPSGYNYGRRLNYERRSRHRGWFTNPLRRLGSKVQPILSAAARAVEQRWGRVT